jgi:hypothetical protein
MSQKFLDWLLNEAFDRAHDPDLGSIRHSALTSVLLENLEEAGILAFPVNFLLMFTTHSARVS